MRNKSKHEVTPVIIFATLWLITMVLCLIFYGDWQSWKQMSYQAQVQEKQLRREQLKKVEDRLHKVQALVGFSSEEESGVSTKKLTENLVDIMDKKKAEYGLGQLGGQTLEEGKLTKVDYNTDLETVINAFESRILKLQEQEALLTSSIRALQQQKESKIREHNTLKEKQQKILDDSNTKHQELEKKYDTLIEQVKGQTRDAEEAREQAKEKRKGILSQTKKEDLDFKNLVIKKKTEIRKIQAIRRGRDISATDVERAFAGKDESVDGKVVFGDPLSNNVYINLGKKQGAFNGLKFDVYRKADKGEKTFKGRLEVQKVMDKVSMAVVTENANKLDPIVNGDLVLNPVFEKERTVYFAFAGRFSKLTNRNAVKFIKELGGKVERRVTSRTNYVVVADKKGKDHENYSSALKFKIPVMSEETLLHYVGH